MTENPPDWFPRRLLDQVFEAVLITDTRLDPPGPRVLYANPAWERLTGHEFAEVRGQTPPFLQGQETETPQVPLERLRQCAEDGRGLEDAMTDHRADGTSSRSDWSVEPIHGPGGSIVGLGFLQRPTGLPGEPNTTVARDVIRELQTLIDIEGLDLTRARQRVARAAMHLSSAEAAVVEEADGDQMVYRAVAGGAEGLEGVRLPIDGSASGYCHASGESLLIEDTLTDERTRLGARAADIGFRSGILVPLLHGERRFGVLKVFSGTRAAFGQTECEFLEMLAGLLAAVLYRARTYEDESRRRRHLVDALPMLVAYADVDRCYREVNAAYADWFGQPVAEILGKPVWEVIGASAYEKVRPYMDRVLEQGEAVSYEETVTFPNDSPTVISVDYSPNVRPDGTVAGFYALVRDITKMRAADLDHLTGLPNRRRFEDEAQRQLEVRQRHGRPLSLVVADIDHFKWWNDTWGHQIGDRILKTIADQIQGEARACDLVARWGGEEFVILAAETDLDGAVVLAERVREQIAATCQPEGEAVTLSLGVAEGQGEDMSVRTLFRAADDALYAAKSGGRNRVARAG